MTTNEMLNISGGYGIVPTCFFPAAPEGDLLPVRGKHTGPLLGAESGEFPVCIFGL